MQTDCLWNVEMGFPVHLHQVPVYKKTDCRHVVLLNRAASQYTLVSCQELPKSALSLNMEHLSEFSSKLLPN